MNRNGNDNYSDRRAPMQSGRSGAQSVNRSGAQSVNRGGAQSTYRGGAQKTNPAGARNYAQGVERDANRGGAQSTYRDGAQRTALGGQRRNPSTGVYPRNTAGSGQTRSASANQGVIGASASGSRTSTSLQSGRRAPVRVRRAADMTRRGGAMTVKEQRSLAKREKKEKEWEAGIQRVRHGVDRPLTVIIIILLCLGTIMVFSASYPNAITEKNDATYYIRRQLLWLAVGTAAMIGASFIPHQLYRKVTPAVAIATMGLLALVLVIGTARGVARRWLYVGSVSVQPSEIAKIALVMALAWYIDRHFEEVSAGRLSPKKTFIKSVLVPGLIMFAFCGMVLLEKHLSGTVILAAIGICVIFLSGAKVWQMALCYGIPAALAGGVYLLTNEYALQRILTHSDENADMLKEAWQTTQGLYAIGSGGLLGIGLGNSNLKHNYVSEAQNDFIFTIWCEEMGLVGAVLLIALYGLFVWRGITVARRAPDTFSSLLAFGITCQVGIQVLLNILVVTDLIPNTGISLPFFSYGGSSLVLLMVEMGMLLSVSKHSFQKNK